MGAEPPREARFAAEELSAEALESGLAGLGIALTPVAARRFRDLYLDTRSRSLAHAGLSARLRAEGRRRTLRIQPSWIAPELVPEQARIVLEATLAAGDDPARVLRRVLEAELGFDLRGVARAEVELLIARSGWALEAAESACRIELRLDRITARRPGARSGVRFAELELFLLEGEPAAFTALTAKLASTLPGLAPARVGRRRRALEHVGLGSIRHAPLAPAIAPLDSTDLVARRVCAQQLAAIRGHQAGARLGLDPEFVHKMRVATRRLRAALRAFAPCFDARTRDLLGRGLKWLADGLGEVRDLDVQLQGFETRRALLGPEPAAGWGEVRDALGAARRLARERLIASLDAPRYRTLLERAGASFAPGSVPRRRPGHPGSEPAVATAEAVISRRAKRFLAQARRCRRAPSPEAVHQLRIRGKKLRYACEFFAPLYQDPFHEGVTRLSELQETLGAQQDGVVSGRIARGLAEQALSRGGSGAYLHVLGVLAGASQATAGSAGAGFQASWEAIGGADPVKQLVREVRRRAAAVREAVGPPRDSSGSSE